MLSSDLHLYLEGRLKTQNSDQHSKQAGPIFVKMNKHLDCFQVRNKLIISIIFLPTCILCSYSIDIQAKAYYQLEESLSFMFITLFQCNGQVFLIPKIKKKAAVHDTLVDYDSLLLQRCNSWVEHLPHMTEVECLNSYVIKTCSGSFTAQHSATGLSRILRDDPKTDQWQPPSSIPISPQYSLVPWPCYAPCHCL